MQMFLGTKMVKGVAMNLGDYNKLQGWDLPEDQNPLTEGYLVEYVDGGKANHPDYTGYISWSPKEQFENAYRKVNGLSFGLAIEAMKKGFRVLRKGWNGKGIFIGLTHPGRCSHMTNPFIFIDTTGLTTDNPDAPICRVPWLASQTDMLADDWEIV